MKFAARTLTLVVAGVGLLTQWNVARACQAERKPAETHTLPDYGIWSAWYAWGECDRTCGTGQEQRIRVCSSSHCKGPDTDARACTGTKCPVDGIVGPWSSWENCSRTCGGGEQRRTRSCLSEPINGGSKCSALEEIRYCNHQECPRKGFYTQWGPWSPCSKSCGPGTYGRSRVCTTQGENLRVGKVLEQDSADQQPSLNVVRDNGDFIAVTIECEGPRHESQSCEVEACPAPVNGNWGQWGKWALCSRSCGNGERIRNRACDRPPASHGGAYCVGSSLELQPCTAELCPVDGAWGSWTACPENLCNPSAPLGRESCAIGTLRICRNCDRPVPQNKGLHCRGSPFEDVECWNVAACNQNGLAKPENLTVVGTLNSAKLVLKWIHAPYGHPTTLFTVQYRSTELDVSTQHYGSHSLTLNTKNSATIYPTPERYTFELLDLKYGKEYDIWVMASGTASMPNVSSEVVKFTIGRVDGGWSEWSYPSACSVTCGRGIRKRHRTCSQPTPVNGGLPCEGLNFQQEMCRESSSCSYASRRRRVALI